MRYLLLACLLTAQPLRADGPSEPRTACKDCAGSGKELCPACKGSKKEKVPCEACGGEGKVPCSSEVCQLSRKPIGCTICFDSGLRFCKTCKGSKLVQVDCRRCSTGRKSTGTVDCWTCGGTGKVALRTKESLRLPSQTAEVLRIKLERSRKSIAHSTGKIQLIDAEVEKLLERRKRIEADFPAADPARVPQASQGPLSEAERERRRASPLFTEVASSLAETKGLTGETAERLRLIDGLEQEVGQATLDRLSALDEGVDGQESYAARLREAAARLETRAGDFRGSVERLEKALLALRKSLEQDARERAAGDRARKATSLSYSRFERALARVPSRSELPQMKCALVEDMTPSSRELCVELSYVDAEAEGSGDSREPRLDEKHLEVLPRLVNEVFRASPETKRVQIAVLARRLGKTGHRVLKPVQRFSFLRSSEWEELMTGEFKDDWRKLLSLSSPKPPYPRETSFFPEGAAFLLVMGLCVTLGVVIIIVVRSRLL